MPRPQVSSAAGSSGCPPAKLSPSHGNDESILMTVGWHWQKMSMMMMMMHVMLNRKNREREDIDRK